MTSPSPFGFDTDSFVTLTSGSLEAALAPRSGGRVAALRDHSGPEVEDILVPMWDWPGPPYVWPKAGAYPLIPYSNRIASAMLAFAGRTHALWPHPDNLPHALHGPSQRRGWQVQDVTGDSATMTLASPPDADWPWSYEARQDVKLSPDGLAITLSVTNTGSEPFPAGLGWHPYFTWEKGTKLAHDGKRIWAHDDAFVATGASEPNLAGVQAPEVFPNAYLSDWSFVELQGPDRRLRLTASPVFGHLVLHYPDSGLYYCAEPVTHLSNGFNLAEQGVADTGRQILAPGETLGGVVELRLL